MSRAHKLLTPGVQIAVKRKHRRLLGSKKKLASAIAKVVKVAQRVHR